MAGLDCTDHLVPFQRSINAEVLLAPTGQMLLALTADTAAR